MKKKMSHAFGDFLAKIRQDLAEKEKQKITTIDMAKRVGISQAHWHRAEKNGYILSQDKIHQIISRMNLDPVSAKVLLAHAGYPNRDISLLSNASYSLADTQLIMSDLFYNRHKIGIIKSVAISWLDPELETASYTKAISQPWKDISDGFSQEEIDKFVQARAERKKKFLEAKIASQFIILETIFEKSVMLPRKSMKKQMQELLTFIDENKFLEIRILCPGPKCPIPATNFRLYANSYLWLGYMYYGEVVCGEKDLTLLQHFDNIFYHYWDKALNKEKSIQRLEKLMMKL